MPTGVWIIAAAIVLAGWAIAAAVESLAREIRQMRVDWNRLHNPEDRQGTGRTINDIAYYLDYLHRDADKLLRWLHWKHGEPPRSDAIGDMLRNMGHSFPRTDSEE